MTKRTFLSFHTAGSRAGEIDDRSFKGHARSILEKLRADLIRHQWPVKDVEDHSFYGVALGSKDSHGEVRIILQYPGPWLLSISRIPTVWKRVMGTRDDNVDEALIAAVDAFFSSGVSDKNWQTREEYVSGAGNR